ncbi:MAG TPA: NAD(P)H-dependent oxidoreductase [Bacilli bacterium]|nr:NAD(P)H-dependent oxidoreductase [Bacilli bacterium]HPS19126.1 NAD(P)H-dependent oxidoreductase [Bacilli bacterium]
MNYLIIYAHPYEKSFNHAVLNALVQNLEDSHQNYEVIDLYKDHFNPAYDLEELRLFGSGQTADPLVKKYQDMIKKAERLVFIFPVWWSDLPAIVKGFIDKVMKKEFAYVATKNGLRGTLTYINKAFVFTSASSTKCFIKYFAGNAIEKTFIKTSLKQMGINKGEWHHISFKTADTIQKRQKYLADIAKVLR